MKKQFILLLAGIMYAASATAQTVVGTVSDCGGGQALAGVSVKVAGTSTGSATDKNGKYLIGNIPAGAHTLEFSFIGMKTVRKEIKTERGKQTTLNVCMDEDPTSLGEVLIEARSERKELKETREQGVPVSVIDGKLLAGRGTTIAEVINHQTGVKVRRTGGVGAESKINVRGLEGNRVQVYLDGKPLNTPDGSFNINDIPLQYIDRIEIYKGIVPPEFGGDGLGSAINVVTIDVDEAYYDVQYSYGSYGQHEGGALYKHYFPKTKMMVAAMYGFGYAKNDYTMESPFIAGLKIKRDHDRFRKHLGAIAVDFRDTYFDECEIEFPFYVNKKQLQGISSNIRHAETSGFLVVAEPKLTKEHFLTDQLDMRFSGLLGYGVNHLSDTSSYVYGFDGTVRPNSYRGELGSVPNLSNDKMKELRYNLNLKYHLSSTMRLNFNSDFRLSHLEANDTIADRYLAKNYSGLTSQVTGMISSLNLENAWFDKRLTTMLTGRNYMYGVTGKTVHLSDGSTAVPVSADESHSYFGYSLAAKYNFSPWWLLKLAMEHNYRLPRKEELLGDRVTFGPNTKLRPEQADNYNIGVMFDRHYDGFRRLQWECNAYLINVNDMLQPQSAHFYYTYYNIGKAMLTGVDTELKWDVSREWFVMLNATYQKSIDKARYVAGTNTPSITYNKQLPHIPILFLNWSLDYRKDNLFGGRGQYSRFYYEGGYTDKYYYGYELTSSQNFTIPATHIHTAGMEYSILDRRILFGLECHNLFDAKELTNFNYPLPGRMIMAKLRITTMKW